MEARYLTDEAGKRVGGVPDVEDEIEDVRRYDALPWEQAKREIEREREELRRRGEL